MYAKISQALRCFKKDRVPALIEVLSDTKRTITEREDAAMHLSKHPDARAITILEKIVLDPTEEAQIAATSAKSLAKLYIQMKCFNFPKCKTFPLTSQKIIFDYIIKNNPKLIPKQQLDLIERYGRFNPSPENTFRPFNPIENNFPIDITYHVCLFRDFLVASWPLVDQLLAGNDQEDDGDVFTEWIQANWEFLMERELLGTDCGGQLEALEIGRRITSPDRQISYTIICRISNQTELVDVTNKKCNYKGEDLSLIGFFSRSETNFDLHPPFDFVKLRTANREKVFMMPLKHCTFYLTPINA